MGLDGGRLCVLLCRADCILFGWAFLICTLVDGWKTKAGGMLRGACTMAFRILNCSE